MFTTRRDSIRRSTKEALAWLGPFPASESGAMLAKALPPAEAWDGLAGTKRSPETLLPPRGVCLSDSLRA